MFKMDIINAEKRLLPLKCGILNKNEITLGG